MIAVFIILLITIFTMFTLAIISKFSNQKWFCTAMGWHKAPITQKFDGCSFYGKCPRCKRTVIQDSQGNWF